MAATPNPNLGPQFYEPGEVGNLHATDFEGRIGDRDAETKILASNAETYGGHAQALAHLNKVRDDISETGGEILKPASVVHFPDGPPRLWDGHHRALTAHQFDLRLPVEHYTWDEVKRRG